MAAPDRIRLTDWLRERPRQGPLLVPGRSPGPTEDPGLGGFGPFVLDPDELAEAPTAEQLEGLHVAGSVRVIEEQEPTGPHLLHRPFQDVDAGHLGRLEEV